ncbi:carboxymuconolactone decarboxylase family protein [Acetobacteraceae bacterium H6797]|nr:carboxymuconolactone decarboxylase family protein [Acetobacteraceae bacterium H6797]
MSAPLTPEQEEMKAAYLKARGYWKPWTEGLLRLSPNFLETYARYGGYPAANGPLSPVMVELIYVALDGSAAHIFESGLKLHMGIALTRGATPLQLIEALHLGTAQGLDGVAVGVDILAEELAAMGKPIEETPWDERQAALKAAYEAHFGDWPPFCGHLLQLDPGYFEMMLALLTCREAGEGLDEKSRCLISLALASCFTALAPEMLRLHLRRALNLGASREEVLQVLQLTAHLGVHACSIGVPALMEVLKK